MATIRDLFPSLIPNHVFPTTPGMMNAIVGRGHGVSAFILGQEDLILFHPHREREVMVPLFRGTNSSWVEERMVRLVESAAARLPTSTIPDNDGPQPIKYLVKSVSYENPPFQGGEIIQSPWVNPTQKFVCEASGGLVQFDGYVGLVFFASAEHLLFQVV